MNMPPARLSSDAAELRAAVFRLSRRLRAERAGGAISDSQIVVLAHLKKAGPMSPGRIAEWDGVTAPSMNRTVNALERLGAVRRVPDPGDGRKVVIELTEAGAAIVDETTRARNAWIERELGGLDAADRTVMHRAAELMTKMAER